MRKLRYSVAMSLDGFIAVWQFRQGPLLKSMRMKTVVVSCKCI